MGYENLRIWKVGTGSHVILFIPQGQVEMMFRPLLNPLKRISSTRGIRGPYACFNSTKQSPPKNKNTVDFRTFITVAIFSTIILTQVVDAVNQDKPRGMRDGMTEAQYYQQQQRLKRKKALFTPEEKQVVLWKDGDSTKLDIDELKKANVEVIDPLKLVETEKQDKESKFFDLLNDSELKELPRGLLVDLVGKFMKNSDKQNFIVVGFPPDVKESIRFEDKVVTIKNLLISENADETDPVFRYYKTVNKSTKFNNTKDTVELF